MQKEIELYIEKKVRSEFTQLRSEQDLKWKEFTEDILERIKPPVTVAQLFNWLFSFISALVIIITFIIFMRSDINQNKENAINYQKTKAEETKELKGQINEILKLATETNNTVIELKTINNVKKEGDEQYRKTQKFFNQNQK